MTQNLARLDLDHPELGAEAQAVVLRHDQKLAVGVEDMLALHRAGDERDMARHPGLGFGIARRGDRGEPGHEGERLARQRQRPPAQRSDRQLAFVAFGRRADHAAVDLAKPSGVPHRRPDAVEPGALVGRVRRREGRARQLLGIEPVAHPLRRVATDRQGAVQGLGLEAVGEARHVTRRNGGCAGPGPRALVDDRGYNQLVHGVTSRVRGHLRQFVAIVTNAAARRNR